MTRRRLPIGIQTFWELRERGCYYVDKPDGLHTDLMAQLDAVERGFGYRPPPGRAPCDSR